MLTWILYGLIAAAAVFAGHSVWSGFTGQYIAEGAAAQLKADAVSLEEIKAKLLAERRRADTAEQDRDAALSASSDQSAAVKQSADLAQKAIDAARNLSIQYAKEKASHDANISHLQQLAAAPPTKGACEEVLRATDQILRESARERSK